MDRDAYELLALAARYVFTGLMLVIVLRAIRGALVDSRRATILRRLSPMTGLSGELVVLSGEGKARRGMRYPLIREGLIGTSRRADIRIRHPSVKRRHAYFQLLTTGLQVRSHANAALRDGRGHSTRTLLLQDGDSFQVGNVQLLLVLSVPAGLPVQDTDAPLPAPQRDSGRRPVPAAHSGAADEPLFDPDTLFETTPTREPSRKRSRTHS